MGAHKHTVCVTGCDLTAFPYNGMTLESTVHGYIATAAWSARTNDIYMYTHVYTHAWIDVYIYMYIYIYIRI